MRGKSTTVVTLGARGDRPGRPLSLPTQPQFAGALAEAEPGQPLDRLVRDVRALNRGMARPTTHERDHGLHGPGRPLEHRLGRPIGAVARPSGHTAPLGLPPHGIAEEHSLHAPVCAHATPDDILNHASTVNGMAAIEVLDTDITTLDVDAIANAANTELKHGGGVAGAISRAGGPAVQRESDAKAPIGLGEATETGAGDMPAKWVIHAATMELGGPTDGEIIRRATKATLAKADELGARSLALVAFGTGVGGFPLDEAARIEVEEVRRHLANGSSLERVVFAVHGAPAREAFEAALA